jgi:hypothetical protein
VGCQHKKQVGDAVQLDDSKAKEASGGRDARVATDRIAVHAGGQDSSDGTARPVLLHGLVR